MTNKQKKKAIKKHVLDMLDMSYLAMKKKVDTVLDSRAINIDDWSEDNAPMVLPKSIVMAILQHESHQYEAKGTSFEKKVKKDVKNISYYL